ncbi:major facilitator superfamily domain-containing protein, partial [Collybia nuda]
MSREDLAVSHDTSKEHVPADEVNVGTKEDANNMTGSVRTKKQVVTARIQLAALCWCLFLAGWNDGTLGPLLPRIQEAYHIGYTIVSLLFVFVCTGFVFGALINVPLTDKYGFGKVFIDNGVQGREIQYFATGSVCQLVAYTLQAPELPFPVFVMAATLNGVGLALQDAQANGFVASIKDNAETKMGILHAVYGLGALAAPLISTQFAQIRRWSFHFLVSIGIAVSNTILLVAVFRFRRQDECLAQTGQPPEEQNMGDKSTFRQILTHKTVHLLA